MHVLVVDDSSPDGTAEFVRELQANYSNLHLLMGQKKGLGVAYIRGMLHAMDELNAEVVFEMDADFSHKPEDVPRLMAEIDRGADFVIGSRYVPGGSIPKEWGLYRRLNSRFGNIVARYLAGIYTVRDCTAGFRAIRTSILRRIDFAKLRVQGYAFQVALLHAVTVQKARIVEVPVDFIDRSYGDSKLGLRDIIEFIMNAWWIRFDSSKTFIKFLLVGASGVIVNLGFFTLLLFLGVNKFIASPVSIELSILSNFFLNNYWTFRWRNTKDRVRIKGLKFNAISLISLTLSYGTFVGLSLFFPNVPPQVHQFIGIIPATLVNYFLNSYWTFKHVEYEPEAKYLDGSVDGSSNGGHSIVPTTANADKPMELICPAKPPLESLTDKEQKLAAILFAGFVACLLASCLFIFDPLKYSIVEGMDTGQSLKQALTGALGPLLPRLLVTGLVGMLLFILLARLELQYRTISDILSQGKRWTFALIGISLLLWFSQAYFYPGHLIGGDSGAHIVRVAHFGRGLSEGKNLFWNNYFYLGAPFLQFYAPLFFWLGGGLFAIIGDIDVAVKLLLFALHVMSGIFFFAFLRSVGIKRIGALIGATGYAGAWAHSNLILFKGTLPPTIIIALMPAAFLLVERIMWKNRCSFEWDWVALAIVSAAMIAGHQAHGMFAGIYLSAYVLARFWMEQRIDKRLLSIGTAGLAGVLISIFAVLPFLVEKSWVIAQAGEGPIFSLQWPTLDYLRRLLVWSNSATSMGRESAAYLGLSLVITGLSVPFYLVKKISFPHEQVAWGKFMLTFLGISLVLRGPMVRDVIYTLFFISALAGLGADCLITRFPQWPRLALALLGIILLDLAPTAVQPVARTDKKFLDEAGIYLANHSPNQRVMLTSSRASDMQGGRLSADMGPTASPLQYYPVQTASGPHNHAATVVHNYASTSIKWAERDLNTTGKLSENSAMLLGLFNISRIVNDTGRGMSFPPSYSDARIEEPYLGQVIPVPTPTPVIFAPQLVKLLPPPEVERPMLWGESFLPPADARALATFRFLSEFIGAMQPQLMFSSASRIPVLELPEGYRPNKKETATHVPHNVLQLHDYQVTTGQVSLKLDVQESGYLEFSHPWYPTIAVYKDDQRIKAIRSTINLIVIPVEAGTHTFRIIPERSFLRQATGTFSALILGLTICVPLVNSLLRRRSLADEKLKP